MDSKSSVIIDRDDVHKEIEVMVTSIINFFTTI